MNEDRNLAPHQPPPTSAPLAPLVSVIVVNYNGGERLARCLESLFADDYQAREVLIVDNASTDESPSQLASAAARYPELKVMQSARNLGYAGGVNLALGAARGRYVAVLNMDLQAERGWLGPLVNFLEAHPEVGAVNPLITLADGERINAVGQNVHVTGLGFNRGLGRRAESIGRQPLGVSGIQGGAFVIRRAILERVGGMDATGFLYHEDVNLSWLLRLMGFELYCVPESRVRHDYFLSMYPAKLHLLERNRWAMLLAYLRRPTLALLLPMLIITESMMWGYCLLRGWAFMRAKAGSYAWVLGRWAQVKERRRLAESVRVVSDWGVLRRLRWSYAWDQFLVLGRERGRSRRQPAGGLPTEVVN